MEIRPERTADEAAVARIHEAAFPHQPAQVVALVNDLRSSTDERDLVSLVAVDNDEPIGHALFTPSLLDALDRAVPVHVLSPIGVLPHVQRRGVGSALVGEGIRILDEQAVPAVFLEGDPDYYRRFGFEEAGPLGFRKPSLRIPDLAFQVRKLRAYEPWMTGTFVYSEPFWRNDVVGLRGERLAAVTGRLG